MHSSTAEREADALLIAKREADASAEREADALLRGSFKGVSVTKKEQEQEQKRVQLCARKHELQKQADVLAGRLAGGIKALCDAKLNLLNELTVNKKSFPVSEVIFMDLQKINSLLHDLMLHDYDRILHANGVLSRANVQRMVKFLLWLIRNLCCTVKQLREQSEYLRKIAREKWQQALNQHIMHLKQMYQEGLLNSDEAKCMVESINTKIQGLYTGDLNRINQAYVHLLQKNYDDHERQYTLLEELSAEYHRIEFLRM